VVTCWNILWAHLPLFGYVLLFGYQSSKAHMLSSSHFQIHFSHSSKQNLILPSPTLWNLHCFGLTYPIYNFKPFLLKFLCSKDWNSNQTPLKFVDYQMPTFLVESLCVGGKKVSFFMLNFQAFAIFPHILNSLAKT
jgi:hypothetical protein